jgi:histidinol-phosphate phosphatase family protein
VTFDIVIPTVGRSTLLRLLRALAASEGPPPGQVFLVDDRDRPQEPLLPEAVPAHLRGRVIVLRGRGRGPAAARNAGWRASGADWIAFLDDDVVPAADWLQQLSSDVSELPASVAGSQGRVVVPLPHARRPTDWERSVKGLETARWATADMAYRRSALERVGGFNERFPRAYREDADLGLRVIEAGYGIARGWRRVIHPPGRGSRWASLKRQAGNADDALMTALHGRGWRKRAGAPPGRRRRHLALTGAALVGAGALALGRRRLFAAAGLAWGAGTAEFALSRVLSGPLTVDEVGTMLATSVAIPPLATYHFLRGVIAAHTARAGTRGVFSREKTAGAGTRGFELPAAVLIDRDGTLVEDVPYNGDPNEVRPLPGARRALNRLRREGIPVAVVSNQSGVARGLISEDQLQAVNQRVDELLGPFAGWTYCPHGPDEGCDCRKPRPGLILKAAELLGVEPERCAVIGDIGADIDAARAAGARAVLVPTKVTRREEIAAAPEVATDLETAVDLLIGRRAS